MILGSESFHCLPEKMVLFGNDNEQSMFGHTPLGIVLYGSIKHFLKNEQYLKPINEKHEKKFLESLSLRVTSEIPIDVDMTTETNVNSIAVLNDKGQLDEKALQKATDEMLELEYVQVLHQNNTRIKEDCMETHESHMKFMFDNMTRLESGRLQVALPWNGAVSHLLGKNFDLAKMILKSNYKKLSKNREHLLAVDKVFKEQEKLGVIKKIPNLNQFMSDNPQCSFLPHMCVIRMSSQSTKYRVEYLSNTLFTREHLRVNPLYKIPRDYELLLLLCPQTFYQGFFSRFSGDSIQFVAS